MWDAFSLLVDRNFIDLSCLLIPVVLVSGSHDTYIVSCLLHCFTFPCLYERKMSSSWSADIDWLATMIVRSGTELPKLFETIHASGILGPSIEEEYEQSMGSGLDTTISQNPQELAGVLGPDGHPFLVRTILDFGCRMAWAPPTKLNRSRNV